jgi:hypothetical protein
MDELMTTNEKTFKFTFLIQIQSAHGLTFTFRRQTYPTASLFQLKGDWP